MMCNMMPCDDPFYGVTWSNCSARCAGGMRSRQTKTNPIVAQEIACNMHSCDPVKGDCKAEVIFLLDSSASYGALNWFIQKQFVMDVVQSLKVGADQTRVGVISFSSLARYDIYPGQYANTPDLLSAIWDIDYMAGDTNFPSGLVEMRKMFERFDPELTLRMAREAANDRIDVFVIGVNSDMGPRIAAIASDPALVFTSESFDVVEGLAQSMIDTICKVGNCSMCDYTNGQIWLPDSVNCHMFYLCEKIGDAEYRKHHMTCGDLWWQQDIHTCVRSPPDGCEVNVSVKTYVPVSTSEAPCPYEPVPGSDGYFSVIGSPNDLYRCLEGMVFFPPSCVCVPVSEIKPMCSDDLLLYFSYEDHYNDVTCHQAVATQYGQGVERRFDPMRKGIVACFSGQTHFEVAFLRTWFAENHVSKFSIAVWYKRHGDLFPKAAIANNNNCQQRAGFSLSCVSSAATGSIMTDVPITLSPVEVNDDDWHHAAWVYDGLSLRLYIDGVLMVQQGASGYMQNNDAPMHIGNDCNGDYFIGCLDEVRSRV
ncbi:hypothetical protein LSAT2_009126 [Lamellibrachia satsuma]|nr:hypothetical protein LSAT2_009126 [Lamellibrachia satsuma]